MKTSKNFKELPVVDVLVSKLKPIRDYLQQYYSSLGDGKEKYLGIRTGLEELDKATLGLDGLIVLGGIAGQGKTSLALQVAFDTCTLGTPVLFYSLEMPRRAIFTKILSRLSRVTYSSLLLNGRGILDGTYSEEKDKDDLDTVLQGDFYTKDEKKRIEEAQEKIEAVAGRFYIRSREREDEAITFKAVEDEINLAKAEHDADKVLVVIDHLQVFPTDDYKDQLDKENRLITGFKDITERTGATVVLISQKNKAGFSGSGKLQEIKGSVDIVYLADLVMFLQEKDEEPEQQYTVAEKVNRKVDLAIVKNRYNAPRTLHYDFDGACGEFSIDKRKN